MPERSNAPTILTLAIIALLIVAGIYFFRTNSARQVDTPENETIIIDQSTGESNTSTDTASPTTETPTPAISAPVSTAPTP